MLMISGSWNSYEGHTGAYIGTSHCRATSVREAGDI